MKKLASAALAAVCTITPVLTTTPTTAVAEPSGAYYYECISSTGLSYWLKDGQKLQTCKGSYLHVYINGQMVRNIRLSPSGSVAKSFKKKDIDCVVSIAGAALLVLTAEASWVWVASAAVAGYGLTACHA